METQKKQIVCIHLFNNYTGSPKVLSQVIKGLLGKGYKIDLITNKTEGFLSSIDEVNYKFIDYRFSPNKVITLLYFVFAQIRLFFIILFTYRKKNVLLYVNTLLPFGAAYAGKVTKKKILYHLHEFYLGRGILNRIYNHAFRTCSTGCIFVSSYLQTCYPVSKASIVAANAIDDDFEKRALDYHSKTSQKRETILLISSLRSYKGIFQFIKLSELLPQYNFEWVASSDEQEIESFCRNYPIPANLAIFSCQKDLHPFYQRAKIVLNLTLPHLCVESFGLTILEAMTYGIPTIVPQVGGPAALVDNGVNGYQIDARNLEEIRDCILLLFKDDKLYQQVSGNALLKSKEFNNEKMVSEVEKFILSL